MARKNKNELIGNIEHIALDFSHTSKPGVMMTLEIMLKKCTNWSYHKNADCFNY